MTLEFTRLGGSQTEPFCTELTGWSPDVTALSVHLSRLPGLTFVAKNSWILTDDVELYFEYRGYRFVIESPFARLWLTALSEGMPETLFREVEKHLLEHRKVSPRQYLKASLRNFMLPRRPPAGWR